MSEFLIKLPPVLLSGLMETSSLQVKKGNDPPLALHGQLLWREFFYTVAMHNPNFDRMQGNPICVQIPWDQNPEALGKWAEVRDHDSHICVMSVITIEVIFMVVVSVLLLVVAMMLQMMLPMMLPVLMV